MKILKEITNWDTPNHTYFVNDSKDKMFAYIKSTGNQVERFRVPMPFRVSGRKFREVENIWGYTVDDRPEGKTWTVAGSRGDSYTVSELKGEWSCTCSGFKFRGQCRHVTEISSTVS